MSCPICDWTPEPPNYLFIHESDHWRAVLAPNQCLLGRCVIHLKRHCGNLAELTEAELLDWLPFVREHQHAVQSAFGARMFNWSVYMNHAYRDASPSPHIHWWAVPRYDHEVIFANLVFDDPQFGDPYDHVRWREVPEGIHQKIAEALRENFQAAPD